MPPLACNSRAEPKTTTRRPFYFKWRSRGGNWPIAPSCRIRISENSRCLRHNIRYHHRPITAIEPIRAHHRLKRLHLSMKISDVQLGRQFGHRPRHRRRRDNGVPVALAPLPSECANSQRTLRPRTSTPSSSRRPCAPQSSATPARQSCSASAAATPSCLRRNFARWKRAPLPLHFRNSRQCGPPDFQHRRSFLPRAAARCPGRGAVFVRYLAYCLAPNTSGEFCVVCSSRICRTCRA